MRKQCLTGLVSLYLAAFFITGALLHAQSEDTKNDSAAASNSKIVRLGVGDPARIHDALGALNALVEQFRKAGNRQAEANALCAIANSYNALHQQQKSIDYFRLALAIWRELGNKESEATTLAHIGDVYRGWGFPDQSNHFYRDALAVYPATDIKERAATLNNLGLTYFAVRDKKKCLESLNAALTSYRAIGDRHGEALTLSNLAAFYTYLGNDPQKALALFQDAVTKLEFFDDHENEANALDSMGVLWLNLGKPEMASLTFQHAIALYRGVGDVQGEASVRKHMRALGQPENIASNK